MTERDALLAHVRSLELRLLDPAVRSQPAELERLLHPDFGEIGASGRTWDRDSIIAALSADPGNEPQVAALDAHAVAVDVVLVTYRVHDRASGATTSRRALAVAAKRARMGGSLPSGHAGPCQRCRQSR